MAGKRIIITLTKDDKLWIESYSKAYKISMAEALRQGLAILRRSEGQEAYRRLVEKTEGIWRKGEALSFQQAMRSEWEKS